MSPTQRFQLRRRKRRQKSEFKATWKFERSRFDKARVPSGCRTFTHAVTGLSATNLPLHGLFQLSTPPSAWRIWSSFANHELPQWSLLIEEGYWCMPYAVEAALFVLKPHDLRQQNLVLAYAKYGLTVTELDRHWHY